MSKAKDQPGGSTTNILMVLGVMALVLVVSVIIHRSFAIAAENSFLKAVTEQYCADYGSNGCQNVLQHRSTTADEVAVEVSAWQGVAGLISIGLLLLTLLQGNRAVRAAVDGANAARDANKHDQMVSKHTVRAYLDVAEAVGTESEFRIKVVNRGETAATKFRMVCIQVDGLQRFISEFPSSSIRRHGEWTQVVPVAEGFDLTGQRRATVILEYDDIFDEAWRGRYHLTNTGPRLGKNSRELTRQDAGEKRQSEG